MTTFVVKSLCSMLLMVVGVYGTYSVFRIYQRGFRALGVGENAQAGRRGSDSAAVRNLSEFKFTERNGKEVSLKGLEGKVWVASFFFASCPGFCTQMNQEIARLQTELKDDDVTFVSITVDPRNDTPEKLATYADHFQADPQRWLFLSGPFEDAHELGEKIFKVTVVPKDHTDRLILVDRDGKVRGTYRSLEPTQIGPIQEGSEEGAGREGRCACSENGDEGSSNPPRPIRDVACNDRLDGLHFFRDLPTVNARLERHGDGAAGDRLRADQGPPRAAHKAAMLAAFGVSVAFLACYVVYHLQPDSMKSGHFSGPTAVRYRVLRHSHSAHHSGRGGAGAGRSDDLLGAARPPRGASARRPLDIADLAVRFGDGGDHLRDAVSRLSRAVREFYNIEDAKRLWYVKGVGSRCRQRGLPERRRLPTPTPDPLGSDT